MQLNPKRLAAVAALLIVTFAVPGARATTAKIITGAAA
jgi:hypothetical protein